MAGSWPVLLFVLLQSVQIALANVEKVVFLGPSSVQIPTSKPSLDDLNLHILTPQKSTLRTELRADFPSDSSTKGLASWFLLDQLAEGQRYEVRICWAATQPTSFWLSTYELSYVFESPDLITSLAEYSANLETTAKALENQIPAVSNTFRRTGGSSPEKLESVLFLQIFAAADYFTSNQTLMQNVPPVLVDIILDPFIFNVLPRSLLPTAGYLAVLATIGWFLAKFIAGWLQMVARTDDQKKKA